MSANRATRRAVRHPASVGAACAAALVLGAGGGVLARTLAVSDPPAAREATRIVHAGPARLEVPRAWQTVRAGPTRVVLAPAPPLRDRVLVTLEPADRPSLVGASLRARVAELSRTPRRVEVGGHPAWEYTGLVDRRGAEALDVTVLPARDAVVNVACVSPIGDVGVVPDCAAAIRSVAFGRSRLLVPAPDLALQLGLPRILGRLDRARREHRAALAAARGPRARQGLARRLADAHADAADAIRPLAGAAGAPLQRQLSTTANAYRALAQAIAVPSAPHARAARRAALTGDTQLAAAVDAVVRRPLPESTAAAAAQTPPPAPTTPGWRWPFILLALVLALVLALCAVRWRAAPVVRPEAPRRDPLLPPVPAGPAPPRWDTPPSSLVARDDEAPLSAALANQPTVGAPQ